MKDSAQKMTLFDIASEKLRANYWCYDEDDLYNLPLHVFMKVFNNCRYRISGELVEESYGFDNILHGPYKLFKHGRKHIECHYKRGKLNGNYEEYDDDGKSLYRIIQYKDGKKHGACFDFDGPFMLVRYVDGIKSGFVKRSYREGDSIYTLETYSENDEVIYSYRGDINKEVRTDRIKKGYYRESVNRNGEEIMFCITYLRDDIMYIIGRTVDKSKEDVTVTMSSKRPRSYVFKDDRKLYGIHTGDRYIIFHGERIDRYKDGRVGREQFKDGKSYGIRELIGPNGEVIRRSERF